MAALLLASPQTASSTVLRASRSEDRAAATRNFQVGAATARETADYLSKTLKKFEDFAEKAQSQIESRHQAEDARLQAAISASTDPDVRSALQASVTGNELSLKQTKSIYGSMVTFSDQMLQLLKGSNKKGYNCNQLECGVYATCTESIKGAQCICNEGYIGNGQDCRAPAEFMPHFLVPDGAGIRASDMSVAVFDGNKVAVVFRDETKANAGALVLGKVSESGLVDLSPLELFTAPNARAFSPVVAGTDGKRLAIAWRDETRVGTCKLRAAILGASGIRGAEMALTWGSTIDFCSNQAHKMSMLSFDDNRVMVLYSDKAEEWPQGPVKSFGNSLLATIKEDGAIKIKGNFRFTDSAVTRLEASRVSPNAFVLAARASILVDDMDPKLRTMQEAMAMYGELMGDELVFNPNPVNLEPHQGQIWARGISHIAPNSFAYAYQDAENMAMKISVVDIHPETHRMKVVQTPASLIQGFSPYVSMLNVPYSLSDPHTLTYYQAADNTSMVNLCSWDVEFKRLGRCQDFQWLSEKISSVSGVPLDGGMSFMAFSSQSGTPYYSIFGLSRA